MSVVTEFTQYETITLDERLRVDFSNRTDEYVMRYAHLIFEFFTGFEDPTRGYHCYGVSSGRSIHEHVCDNCKLSYTHEHNIKHPWLQSLYNNWCDHCQTTCERVVTKELIGYDQVKLPSLQQLESIKRSLVQSIARLRTEELCSQGLLQRFSGVVTKQVPKVEGGDMIDRVIRNIDKLITLQRSCIERLSKMSGWNKYIGRTFVGMFGPITFEFRTQMQEIVYTMDSHMVTIGDDALSLYKRYADASKADWYVLYTDRIDYMRRQIHELRKEKLDEPSMAVLNDLNRVVIKLEKFIGLRYEMLGYVEVDSERIRSHHHYSKSKDFIPLVVYDARGVKVCRHVDGYKMFVLNNDSGSEELLWQYIQDNPVNHVHWVTFQTSNSTAVTNVQGLFDEIERNWDVLYRREMYDKLLWLVSRSEYQSNDYYRALNYLRASHYYVFRERSSARAFLFAGPPGLGKSYDVSKIVGNAPNVYYYTYEPRNKQYFDGYRGQPIMVIDDIGHYKPDEWLILLRLISDIPFRLSMAAASMKDKIPSLVEEIYLTTNCYKQLMSLKGITKDAICRRMDLFQYHADGNVSMCVYNIRMHRYLPVRSFTRQTMLDYFQSNVVAYRQEPRYEVGLGVWHYADVVFGSLHLIRPELGLLDRLYRVGRSYIQTGSFETLVPVICVAVSMGLKVTKFISESRLDSIGSKAVIPRRDYTYLQQVSKSHPNNVRVQDLLMKAESQRVQNVCGVELDFSVDTVYDVREETVMKYHAGVDVPPFDYTGVSEEIVESFGLKELKGYHLDPWTEPVKVLYMTKKPEIKAQRAYGIFRDEYSTLDCPHNDATAPYKEEFMVCIDESDYRPNMPYTWKAKYALINAYLHPSGGRSKTQKRREERKRGRVRDHCRAQ